jgi:hypothetical protein
MPDDGPVKLREDAVLVGERDAVPRIATSAGIQRRLAGLGDLAPDVPGETVRGDEKQLGDDRAVLPPRWTDRHFHHRQRPGSMPPMSRI